MQKLIEDAFAAGAAWPSDRVPELQAALALMITALERGEIRAANKTEAGWQPVTWVKQGILLKLRYTPATVIAGGAGGAPWFDKLGSQFAGWQAEQFQSAKIRAVPGCYVRPGCYVAKDTVLMPSFINIGAYVDSGCMIDTWATVGSCAQIGKNVHISGGTGIGGVLEPVQATPVIIEDDCFIGARAEIAEGVIVEQGAVIAMGCFISASTKIIDRATGAIYRGRVPAYSVVVPGNIAIDGGLSLACAVIVKQVDAQTRAKTSVNALLREAGVA